VVPCFEPDLVQEFFKLLTVKILFQCSINELGMLDEVPRHVVDYSQAVKVLCFHIFVFVYGPRGGQVRHAQLLTLIYEQRPTLHADKGG
jgi:hypothetical protein